MSHWRGIAMPPLMLSIAVWAAAKNALAYIGPTAAAELRLPATGEEMLRCLTLSEPVQQPATADQVGNGVTANR